MLDWKPLVYAGKCRTCGRLNRYIIIIPGFTNGKAKDIMKARILICQNCGERVKATKERPPLPAGFLGRDEPTSKMRNQCFFKSNKMRRRILVLTPSAYKISINLDELFRAGFLGVVTVRVNEVDFTYHFLENGIVPIYQLNSRREVLGTPDVPISEVLAREPEPRGIVRRIHRSRIVDVQTPEEEEE